MEYLCKLVTQENGIILDPFLGSGTTCEVAQKLHRNSIGIDILPQYVELAKKKVSPVEVLLLEKKAKYGKHIKK